MNKPEFYPLLLTEVDIEIEFAVSKFPPFHSMHEGYGVLLEEVDELWDWVKTKNEFRIKSKVHKECIQIAAMALRMIIDCEKDDYKK